jgi:hypothetical protein
VTRGSTKLPVFAYDKCLNFKSPDDTINTMIKALPLLLLTVCGCSGSANSVKLKVSCAQPLPGFHSFHDPNFKKRWPFEIGDYESNVVKITEAGAITWNDVNMASMHNDGLPAIEQFLIAVKSFSPQPFTVLDFDAGAACRKVKAVRALMEKHLRCSESDLCIQGNWE